MPLDANFFPQYRELLHGQAVERSLLFAATLLSLENCQGGDSNPYGFLHQILSLARLPIPPPWLVDYEAFMNVDRHLFRLSKSKCCESWRNAKQTQSPSIDT